uniref:Hexosyltransferase n=1 Tax=Mesocestoides corti TaxID=53468 RepID=A0A5K3FYG5_MESCO
MHQCQTSGAYVIRKLVRRSTNFQLTNDLAQSQDAESLKQSTDSELLSRMKCDYMVYFLLVGFFFLIIIILLNKPGLAYIEKDEAVDEIPASLTCKWPPSTPKDFYSEGGYNITLCVRLDPRLSPTRKPKKYPLSYVFRNWKGRSIISFEELGKLSRRFWKLVRYPEVYRTYPQDVPLKQIVKAVKAGLPVTDMPQYNFPIRILKTSKSVCSNSTKHDLVIVVKSGILGWDARTAFREFMQREKARSANLHVGVVFSLGLPRKHGGRLFNREGNIISLPEISGDMLEQFNGKEDVVMERINKEIENYDDIVLADYEDTYYNLTWKTVTNLRWLSAFCNKYHANTFMIIDDDHRMNLSMVAPFLKSASTETMRKSIFGFVGNVDYAYRSPTKKWFLSYREFPWDLMYQYPRGFSQFIGADIIDDMAIVSAYTRYNYSPEDVFLGMIAFKLGIDLHNVDSMYDHTEYAIRNTGRQPAMVAMKDYFG